MRASYAGDTANSGVRGGHLYITNDGEFSTSIVDSQSGTLTSQLTSYVLGRNRTAVLAADKAKFCRISDVVKSGYLDKRGSWFKSFKRRYFVLRGDLSVLSYYESDQTLDKLLGSLYLQPNTTIIKLEPTARSSMGRGSSAIYADEFTFLVRTPSFTEEGGNKKPKVVAANELILRAKSEKERNAWIHNITHESKRGSGPRERRNKEIDWWNTLFSSNDAAHDMNITHQKQPGGSSNGSNSPGRSVAGEGGARRGSRESSGAASGADASRKSSHNGIDVEIALNRMSANDMASRSLRERRRGDKETPASKWKSQNKADKIDEEDSDGEGDVDFDIERFRSTTMFRHSNETGGKAKHARISRKQTKYKQPKTSAVQPPPAEDCMDFAKFVSSVSDSCADSGDRKSVKGIQICLELCNMVHNYSRVFVMLIGMVANNGTAGEAGGSTKGESCLVELYRTEDVELVGAFAYGMPIAKCHVNFSTLAPVIPENVKSICAAVFNADIGQEELAGDTMLLNDSLCYYTFPRSHMNHTAFYADMKVSTRETKVDLTNPNVDPKSAKLGVITVESEALYRARDYVTRVIPYNPYSEKVFSFRLVEGYTLSNEQIFASIYSVKASRAFIEMIIDEREPVLAGWLKHLQIFMRAKEDDLASANLRIRESSNERNTVNSGNLDTFLNTMSENLEASDLLQLLVMKLELAKETYDKCVCDLEDIIVLYDGVTVDNLDTTDQIQNLIKGAQAGGYLRRSPWKKASLWQYATTNLNIHMVTSSIMRNDQVISGKERAKDEEGEEEGWRRELDENIIFSPVITLGVPAAHSLKYKNGGLTRIFVEAGCDSAIDRKFWMEAIQNSDHSCKKLFTMAWEKGEQSFHFMKKLLHLEKFPDAQLSEQNWVEAHMEVDVQQKRFVLASRIEVCVSQLLGFACCALRTIINLATLQPNSKYFDVLVVSLRAGFLLPLQSLLSTHGAEQGMIEDLDGAVLFLRGCEFKIMKHNAPSGQRPSKKDLEVVEKVRVSRNSRTKKLYVCLFVTNEEASVVRRAHDFWKAVERDTIPPAPPGAKRVDPESATAGSGMPLAPVDVSGSAITSDRKQKDEKDTVEPDGIVLATIKMVSAFMTQGVNEMQTAVNSASYVTSTSLQVQVDINRENLEMLEQYIPDFNKWYSSMAERRGNEHEYDKNRKCNDLTASLERLRDSVDTMEKEAEKKHVSILTTFAYLSRSTCGTVGILCKSGKDRTGMSATLELVRSLVEDADLIFGERAVMTLREKGARRMNVWANTGQSMFAFNSIQRSLLPACYRPPPNTFSGNVAT